MTSRILPLLAPLKFSSDVSADSFLCNLHYKYIRNFFIASFTLSLTRQLYGEYIICHNTANEPSKQLLDTACFINGTFSKDADGNITFHHNYYQWIPLLLILEACSFYLPYHIWFKHCGLYLRKLQQVKDLESCQKVIKMIEETAGYKIYWKTCFLEWFYSIHLIIQACIVNVFFNYGFSYPWNLKVLHVIFPDYGLCWFDYYNGAFITTGRYFCLLPLNVLYRKIFLIVSIGFWIVIFFHIFYLSFRVAWAFVKEHRRGKNIDRVYSYQMAERYAQDFECKRILKNKMCLRENGVNKMHLQELDINEL